MVVGVRGMEGIRVCRGVSGLGRAQPHQPNDVMVEEGLKGEGRKTSRTLLAPHGGHAQHWLESLSTIDTLHSEQDGCHHSVPGGEKFIDP